MANLIQVKRGLFATLPILSVGEFAFTTDTHQAFIGDGSVDHELILKDEYNANSFLYATTAKTPVSKTPAEVMEVLSGTALADFSMNSKLLKDVGVGVSPTDGVNKGYVDGLVQGIKLQSEAIIKADINVDIAAGGLLTLQTIVLKDGDQVLLTSQTTGTENGLYVAHSGAWTRALNWEVGISAAAFYVFIKEGTYDNAGFVCTNDSGTDVIGTDTLTFAQFSGAGQIVAGAGLTKTANTLNVGAGDGIQVNADTIQVTADVIRDADFNAAHTILAADALGTPSPYVVGADSVVGRVGTGNIGGIVIDTDLTSVSTSNDTLAYALAIKTYVDSKVASKDTLLDLLDTPSAYVNGYFLRSSASGIDFVAFDSTAGGTSGVTKNAPTSGAFYAHDKATTGVHGAGLNTLLNSGSLIDGGTF